MDVQTLFLVALLIAFGLAFRAKAATPTTDPVDLEKAAIDKLDRQPDAPGTPDPTERQPSADTDRYLAERQEALNLLREAAKISQATYTANGNVQQVIGSLNGPRSAVNLLVLSGQANVANGRFTEAVDDFVSAMAVGRHVGQQKLFVSRLVDVGCGAYASNALANALSKLPDNIVAGLSARLATLPPRPPLAEVIEADWAVGEQMTRDQAVVEKRSASQTERSVELFKAARPLYDAAKAAADASPDEYVKAINTAAAKLLANPHAQVVLPSLRTFRGIDAVAETQRAMLLTAVAIRLHGPDVVAHSVDPFGHGPFTYVITPTGYALKSTFAIRLPGGGTPLAFYVTK